MTTESLFDIVTWVARFRGVVERSQNLDICSLFNFLSATSGQPSEEFELTANSLGAHMKFTESSPGMGDDEREFEVFFKFFFFSVANDKHIQAN